MDDMTRSQFSLCATELIQRVFFLKFFLSEPSVPTKNKKSFKKMDSTFVYVIDCANIEATCFCVVHFLRCYCYTRSCSIYSVHVLRKRKLYAFSSFILLIIRSRKTLQQFDNLYMLYIEQDGGGVGENSLSTPGVTCLP
jgi:hypothetical protein